MFHLSKIQHTLLLQPHLLSLSISDAIKGELEKLFLDKVIPKLGLCISIYDILSIEIGYILPGDGCSTYVVEVRLVMFQPYAGEILRGKIEESNHDGLRLTLGFFNDIYVPVNFLQNPCIRGDDGIWQWNYDSQVLPMNLNEEVHFSVKDVKYPPIPVNQDEKTKPFVPMQITAEMNADGLGLISWWQE